MTTFRDSLLPLIDSYRGLPGQLGLRLFTVTVVQRTWTGARVGLGTPTSSPAAITVALGTYQVKARQLSQRDVVASGGVYSDQDFEIGPFTPPFTGSSSGGIATSVFDPPVTSSPTEILYKVEGPGFPSTGGWFTKIGQRVDKAFRYTITIRKTAETP